MTAARPALEVQGLSVAFDTRNGRIGALRDISFSVAQGEVLGLVGESGSGKSLTGLAILGLIDPPGRVTGGSIRLDGQELLGLPEAELRKLRGRRISTIFQDPSTTLNPVLRIDTQMIEAIRAHENVSNKAARARAVDALAMVGIPSPEERLDAYPHQFSGGMRQRVAIAIALLHHPSVLIADEPTTALDVTIQAQILGQVQKLAAESATALVWITHDLSVIAGLADRVAVMYAGRVVETGSVEKIIVNPMHPYTEGLLASVPSRNKRGEPLKQIRGGAPSLRNMPPGCPFSPRCERSTEICTSVFPEPRIFAEREVKCYHPLGAPLVSLPQAGV